MPEQNNLWEDVSYQQGSNYGGKSAHTTRLRLEGGYLYKNTTEYLSNENTILMSESMVLFLMY